VVLLTGMTELSSLLSFIALVVSISIGVSNLKQRVNEPNEKRWRAFGEWKKEVDEKLDRDYHSINTSKKQMYRRQDFEQIMLFCMKGILNHLASGNHTNEMKAISQKIDNYLINNRIEDDNGGG
jgi:hypothetical protein